MITHQKRLRMIKRGQIRNLKKKKWSMRIEIIIEFCDRNCCLICDVRRSDLSMVNPGHSLPAVQAMAQCWVHHADLSILFVIYTCVALKMKLLRIWLIRSNRSSRVWFHAIVANMQYKQNGTDKIACSGVMTMLVICRIEKERERKR